MCVNTEKKLQLNIARLRCHNFLSLVVFWLGGGRAPWASPLATPMAQIQEPGAVAKSAASHLLITEMHDIKQCRHEKKSKNGYVIGSGYLTRKSKWKASKTKTRNIHPRNFSVL